jgi:alpha-tubulin suppressor-like RCC1 family protein
VYDGIDSEPYMEINNGTALQPIETLVLFRHPSPGNYAVSIDAGGAHTCVVLRGGRIMCWGSNGFGQLGIGSTLDTYSPTAVDLGVGAYTQKAGVLVYCGHASTKIFKLQY